MSETTPSLLTTEQHGAVTVLRMDDGKANALSHAMLAELNAALDAAPTDSGSVVLAGRPGRFCAGFDMSVMMAGPRERRALVAEGAELLLKLYRYPRPVVAAVTGHALAGGSIILLTADVRIGVEGPFRIGLNEVSIGMPLPTFGIEMARSRLCVTRLHEAAVLARTFEPVEAARVGFLDVAVPEEQFEARVMETAAQLAELPDPAFVSTKRRLRQGTVQIIRDTLAEEMDKLAG